jgi:hypothetical protein
VRQVGHLQELNRDAQSTEHKNQGTVCRKSNIKCILGNTTTDGTVLVEALILQHEATSAVNFLTPQAVITFFVLDFLWHLLTYFKISIVL